MSSCNRFDEFEMVPTNTVMDDVVLELTAVVGAKGPTEVSRKLVDQHHVR